MSFTTKSLIWLLALVGTASGHNGQVALATPLSAMVLGRDWLVRQAVEGVVQLSLKTWIIRMVQKNFNQYLIRKTVAILRCNGQEKTR